MKELNVNIDQKDYRELFALTIDSNTCMVTCIGITKEGEFLYIKNTLMNNSSAYWVDREFFSITKEEFCEFLKQAKTKGYVEKAIKNKKTTEEELNFLSK